MTNPNSNAQRSFAMEPFDSVADVLASKRITPALAGSRVYTKDGKSLDVVTTPADHVGAAGATLDIVPAEGNTLYDYGAGRGGDDSSAFEKMMRKEGRVVGRPGDTYRLMRKIEVNVNVDIDWRLAHVVIGPAANFTAANKNILTFKPGCSHFTMRNLGGTTLNWTNASNGSCADFICSFDNMSSAAAFPQGASMTAHMPSRVIIEDNIFGSAKIALGIVASGSEVSDARVYIGRNLFGVPNQKVYTYHVYTTRLANYHLDDNDFVGNYIMENADYRSNCDIVKTTGSALNAPRITNNRFRPTNPETFCQVDVYSGGMAAFVSGNEFRNAHFHRKVTSSSGVVPFIVGDVVMGNTFIATRIPTVGTSYSFMYIIGGGFAITGNTFVVMPDVTLPSNFAFTIMEIDDNNNSPIYPGEIDQSASSDANVSNNVAYCSGVTGGTITFIYRQPPAGSWSTDVTERRISVIGNVMRGGDRFLSGVAGALVGNAWTTERTGISHNATALTAVGNIMPSGVSFTGKGLNGSAERILAVDAATTSTLDAVITNKFRVTGTGQITNILNGTQGQEITIFCRASGVTIKHNTNIRLAGSADWVMPGRSMLTLIHVGDADGGWHEKCRMVP
jgi:hypothetical protein